MFLEEREVATSRLHHELETTIRGVNRELMSVATGPITRHALTNVTRMVATLRGRYLQCALRLSDAYSSGPVGPEAVLELRPLREAYTEAIEAFAALEHALQRGYVSLED